ncbi:hypothetical protein H5410_039464 [Solanum commersonii]|uniref:Uncharacterized protein n=1 Tax=Solanum commersonii TaxID=4109 RepID=A0A9J5XPL8_SOLCO|nr:hypothetical protein H5410_039464 [Solanum commersonii]
MFKKIIDIFIARLGKRYCRLFVHQLISKFDDKLSTLYFNTVDDPNLNCQASSGFCKYTLKELVTGRFLYRMFAPNQKMQHTSDSHSHYY